MQHWDSAGGLPLCRSIRGLYWYEAFWRENNLYRGGSGGAVRYLRAQGVRRNPAAVGGVHGRCSGIGGVLLLSVAVFLHLCGVVEISVGILKFTVGIISATSDRILNGLLWKRKQAVTPTSRSMA